MKYYCIIDDNTVIDRIVVDDNATEITYAFPHDLIVEDTEKKVMIGSSYDPLTGVFSSVGVPQDPAEGTDGE